VSLSGTLAWPKTHCTSHLAEFGIARPTCAAANT